MLLKFNFKNFKSFKDEVSLDLTATKITEFSDRNFEVGNIKVLPIASIFGANASGKSNVMEAFRFMVDYVIMSLNFAGGQINPALQNRVIKPIPFLFDSKSKNEGSKFEIYFVMNNDKTEKIYQYGFVFNNSMIEEEWLYYKAKTSREDFKNIFYRSKDENDFSGLEKDKIDRAILFSTSMWSKRTLNALKKILQEKGISVEDDYFYAQTNEKLLTINATEGENCQILGESTIEYNHKNITSVIKINDTYLVKTCFMNNKLVELRNDKSSFLFSKNLNNIKYC